MEKATFGLSLNASGKEVRILPDTLRKVCTRHKEEHGDRGRNGKPSPPGSPVPVSHWKCCELFFLVKYCPRSRQTTTQGHPGGGNLWSCLSLLCVLHPWVPRTCRVSGYSCTFSVHQYASGAVILLRPLAPENQVKPGLRITL